MPGIRLPSPRVRLSPRCLYSARATRGRTVSYGRSSESRACILQGWPGTATNRSQIINLPPLGPEVAKLKFNACLMRAGGKLRHKVFPDNPQGFAQLSEWLKKQEVKQVHDCLEAAGTNGDSLAIYLHEQDHFVSVINPAAIKAYAQSFAGVQNGHQQALDTPRSMCWYEVSPMFVEPEEHNDHRQAFSVLSKKWDSQ